MDGWTDGWSDRWHVDDNDIREKFFFPAHSMFSSDDISHLEAKFQ